MRKRVSEASGWTLGPSEVHHHRLFLGKRAYRHSADFRRRHPAAKAFLAKQHHKLVRVGP